MGHKNKQCKVLKILYSLHVRLIDYHLHLNTIIVVYMQMLFVSQAPVKMADLVRIQGIFYHSWNSVYALQASMGQNVNTGQVPVSVCIGLRELALFFSSLFLCLFLFVFFILFLFCFLICFDCNVMICKITEQNKVRKK